MRRNLLKMAGLLFSGLLPMPKSQLYAAADNYQGPLWLFVNADGGWDPTMLCDPKGYAGSLNAANPNRVNNYDQSAIQQIGNIRIAPPPDSFQFGGVNYDSSLYAAQTFFAKHLQKILVINGIDSGTNIHADGQLFNLAGQLRETYPCFGALVAGTLGSNKAMPFLTYGGYSSGADLVTPVRMSNSALNAMYEMAYPNRSFDPRSSNSRLYLSNDIQQLIHEASQARHIEILQQQNLIYVRNALEKLLDVRTKSSSLQGFVDRLLLNPTRSLSSFNGRSKAYALYQQGRVALASYAQGLTIGANIMLSGFDTHAKHDELHYPLLMDLLQGVDAVIQEAEMLGLADRLVVVMTSDFGRTPRYNPQEGKDHWPIGSALIMGNSIEKVVGNRVIGATSSQFEAFGVDPFNLAPDYTGRNPNSIKLTPGHLHQSLRTLAGINALPTTSMFPLEVQELSLFS